MMHLGRNGPGSTAACGNARAGITYGKDRFIKLEHRCTKCTKSMEATDRVMHQRTGVGADSKARAAGITFIDPNSNALFVRRSDTAQDYAGYWTWAGGGIEGAESPEQAARREAVEELGKGVPAGDVRLLDRQRGDIDYTTYAQHVQEQFPVKLNDENDEYRWAPMGTPPWPLHPGVKAFLAAGHMPSSAMDAAMAFDRESVRKLDKDGRLHVEITNISKANICPYIGKEIPGWKELGLDPDRVYQMFRDPDELAKGAATFNNLPVLSEHIPVTAWDHRPDLVIGSTGTDAVFEAPYLRNSMVFWVMDEILQIEDQSKCELSSAYRYRADMTPGEFGGVRFDGVMRDIVGNHVALVPDGRAGDDVVVGDSNKELKAMAKKTKKVARVRPKMHLTGLSPLALVAKGVLMAGMAPLLAQDAALDFDPILKGVTAKNYKKEKPQIFKRLEKASQGLLAQDASLDAVMGLLDAVEQVEQPDAVDALPVDGPDMQPDMTTTSTAGLDEAGEFLKSKLSSDDKATYDAMCAAAKDAEPDDDKKPSAADADDDDDTAEDAESDDDKGPPMTKDGVSKPAMDAALRAHGQSVAKRITADMKAVRVAEADVRTKIGEFDVLAFDSADAIYRHGLETLGMDSNDLAELPTKALAILLKQQPALGAPKVGGDKSPKIAMDARSHKSFAERNPDTARIGFAT